MTDQATVDSSKAVSLGLIVTELVINAIKYAFPHDRQDAQILVTYEVNDADWKLSVSDNGVGKIAGNEPIAGTGLGTTIVDALAKQLDARVKSKNDSTGLKVSIERSSFASHLPEAA